MSSIKIVDAKKMSLTEWLDFIFSDKKELIIDYSFPTDTMKEEYIEKVNTFKESEIKDILRKFLIHSGSLYFDNDGIVYRSEQRPDLDLEFDRRHKSAGKAWEGITWVLDLLPHWPAVALEALNAFSLAHCQLLPDGRSHGLYDAMAIIRSRYIFNPQTVEDGVNALLSLSAREFEVIISKLYVELGYKIELTKFTKDGGVDITCQQNNPGHKEKLLVQCKRYKKNVGVPCVRELYGVQASEKVNKATIVAPIGFSKPAKKFADKNNIELLAGETLITLLNSHLGPLWAVNIDSYIVEEEKLVL